MKKIIFLFIISVIFYCCGGEEPVKVETTGTEAFAYDIGGSWEVNATTRVKGFFQKEEDDNYLATIAFDIDLIIPSGDTIKALISRVEDKTNNERIIDIPLDIQFELDSTYSAGDYKIIFNIKDAGSNQTATAEATFQLTDE